MKAAAGFIKALGLRDVVLMNIVAVVGMRWIARGARTGPASVTLWILAWMAFFVPLAVLVDDRQTPVEPGRVPLVRVVLVPGLVRLMPLAAARHH